MANLSGLRARVRVPRPEDFRSPVHHPAVTARIGRFLGAAVVVCFVTGLMSHNAQQPGGVGLGPWPVWGYRLSQGLHVSSGIACLPLLLAKVFAAYPRLFQRPLVPGRDRSGVVTTVERLSTAVLLGAAFFEVSTGVLNINQWYVFGFGFVPVHYALAWVLAGALLVHLGVKLPVIRRVLGRPEVDVERRAFVRAALGVTGLLTLLSVGQSLTPLSRLAVLAPRRPAQAALQGLPVNKTAAGAGLLPRVGRAGWGQQTWRLSLVGPAGATTLALHDLAELEQVTVTLPISCVEGWSVDAEWTGVRVRDLVRRAGGDARTPVRATSLERGSPYSTMLLQPAFAAHPDTLLATHVNGEVLHPDHGYPARIIAPNRPGVLQTKWVERLEVLA